MSLWQQFEFSGIAPRYKHRLIPRTHGVVAHDVDLTYATLKAFREPKRIGPYKDSVRLYAYDCHQLQWDSCVSVAEWLPDCPRLFITGRNDYPETATVADDGSLTYRRLGVPRPNRPPVATAPIKEGELARETAYVVTYVNSFDEEGGPSLPSADITIEDGDDVRLSLGYNPPMEYDIKYIRVYRRETGFRTGAEKEQELATEWFLVAELPVDTENYTDNLRIVDVDFGLPTRDNREPPADLHSITAINEGTTLVGAVRNKLLFSKALQPHNFMLHDEMTLDDNIVALGSYGSSVFVATDGYPYRLVAEKGCDEKSCRDIIRYDEALPMIACHTGKGSIVTPIGFVYVSADGLVLLNEQNQPRIITSEVLSVEQWRQLEPHTIRLGYHKSKLFIVSDRVSFVMWLDTGMYGEGKNRKLITISDKPIDMSTTRQGELLMLTTDGVYHWEAGNKLRPYTWVSPPLDFGYYYDITRVRCRIAEGSVDVTTESDRADITRLFPQGDTTIPYKRHGRRKSFNLRFNGTGEVLEVGIGMNQVDMSSRGGN